MNQPKAGLSFLPSIFFDNCAPIIIPTMEMDETVASSFQLIGTLCIEVKNPIREFREMMTSEVPMATFIGVLSKLTSAGIIIKPPPAPTKPVSTPTTDPCPAAKDCYFY